MRNRKGSEAFANPAPTAVWLIQIVSELCLSCAPFPALLSHAEIPKYIPQNFLRAYLPDDFPEMIQSLAKVLRDQIRRQRSQLEPVADTPESRRSAYQGLIMTDIRHQCLIGIACDTSADFRQSFCQHS